MASTLSNILGFFEKGDGDDPKHKSFEHAISVCVLFHIMVLAVGLLADELMAPGSTAGSSNVEEFPAAPTAALAILSYWIFLVGLRLYGEGGGGRVLVIYELCWACSASLPFAATAAYLRRPALLCACALWVAIDQVLWYVDIIGYALIGKFPVKVCGYLFWPSTSWTRRITSLHHVLFAPIVVILCARGRGVPLGRGFLISLAQTVICQLICRYTTPLEMPHKKEKNGLYYMNINLCYEAFRDVKVAWIRRCDRMKPIIYLPWMLWIWNLGNFLFFIPQVCIFLLGLYVTSSLPGIRIIF
eukprot:TRINITY_DN68633_c0_g1_i1.p1 TRINITY_DN68633_c0_g1~~TRINITY_DN68633_c0_g1_i1.p1  ORF type:complete len:316 (+),score=33.90 TRINITY_DN68633_c0_g1_i1:46-948(+)